MFLCFLSFLCVPLLDTFSDPARSTRLSFPTLRRASSPPSLFFGRRWIVTEKMVWDRDDALFINVSAVRLFFADRSRIYVKISRRKVMPAARFI